MGKRPLRLQRRQYLSACVIILPHLLFVFVFNSAYLPPRRATKGATTPLKPRADAVFVEASAPAPSPAPETSQLHTVCAILSHPANTHAFSFIFSPSLKLAGFRHSTGKRGPQIFVCLTFRYFQQSGASSFPQLDKYKVLFDASNPDRAPSDTQTRAGMMPAPTYYSTQYRRQDRAEPEQQGEGNEAKQSRLMSLDIMNCESL